MIRMNREKPDYSGRWKREKCECMVGGAVICTWEQKNAEKRDIEERTGLAMFLYFTCSKI